MNFALDRFLTAQEMVYAAVRDELALGKKTGHWMWFIFPQIVGLGTTEKSRFYAIASLVEAREYLLHPVLGQRLRECTELVTCIEDCSLLDIFGPVDSLKFCSSMTLFMAAAADNDSLFRGALALMCEGRADQATLDLLLG